MPKRALIAEPDPDEALRQAAILKDDGYETTVFTGSDIVAALESDPPDLLVLRHERPGGQNGLALVPRLKSIASGTAIVVTTSDLTPDAIEKNRKQKVHADGYLRLPVERQELVDAARATPVVLEAAEVAEEAEKPVDPRRPPPLPPSGLRALSQLPRAGSRAGDAVLTAEDLTFVEKVFSSIQHVDADAPIAETPSPQLGDVADRKVALLRTTLKQRERDLAKISRLWRAREEDLRQQESRVQQKDIEAEGLRLRIGELSAELESAHTLLQQKENEFGRAIGETYDQQALQQAELIQQVAGKENELNALKTKLRKTEDAWAAEKKEFTERVFEWERAYAEFEQHHWKVVEASVDEVLRLEQQVRQREQDRASVFAVVKQRDEHLARQGQHIAALRTTLRQVEHAAAGFEEAVVKRAAAFVERERRVARDAIDDGHELRARLLDVEEDLARHQVLLRKLDQQRRKEIARLVSVVRAGDSERTRLEAEREAFRLRSEIVSRALDETRALGEATANQLFTLEEKRRIVGEAQVRIRDGRIGELNDDVARLSQNLGDVTERLANSEMEHTAEEARANELERALAETREDAQEEEARLTHELQTRTDERDRLADNLQRSETSLEKHKVDLAEERRSRQQREIEFTGIAERKDNEIAAKNEKLTELDRALTDARDDIQNLRKTVSVRDERITELLNRVRQSDEQQVALEGQVFRLTTSNQEKEADLIARDERLAQQSQKLSQREERVDQLEAELRKTQATVLDKQAAVERTEQNVASLQAELSRVQTEAQRVRADLEQRGTELFETERRLSTTGAELSNARAEIAAAAAITEQLQSKLNVADQRGAELRRMLDETDAKLRATLQQLDASGQENDELRSDAAELRALQRTLEGNIEAGKKGIAELERARDQLMATSAELYEKIAAGEQERHELDEQYQEQLASQLRENGDLSASLSDAAQRLEEMQARARQLEGEISQREGRIVAQAQILEKAEAQAQAKDARLAESNQEIADLRTAVEEAKSAIEERARWLTTREQSIQQLKAELDTERQGRTDASTQAAQLGAELAQLRKTYDETRARLDERERLLQAQGQHAQEEVEREIARAQRAIAENAALKTQLEQAQVDLGVARTEAQRGVELKALEEKTRSDALKLRQIAERTAAELKATRVTLERTEAARKAVEADALKARAELDDLRNAQKQGDAIVQQARIDAEQRAQRLAELQQQLARAQQQRADAERVRVDLETELARARQGAEQEVANERASLREQVERLNAELNQAKKARADALAQAQQAKAESEQIKRLAAQRIQQAQAAQRESRPPRTSSSTTLPPSLVAPQGAAPSETLPPTMVLQRPAPDAARPVPAPGAPPPPPPVLPPPGMAPPPRTAAPVASPFGAPTATAKHPSVQSMVTAPGGPPQGAAASNYPSAEGRGLGLEDDTFTEGKTAVMEKLVVPPEAKR